MLEVVVRVSGDRAAARSLDTAVDRMPAAVEAGEVSGAALVARQAAARAPRRTGRLAASTQVLRSGDRVGVGSRLSYFWPVHSGVPGRGQEARPFVVEAGQDLEGRVVDGFEREVERIVRGV